MKKEFFCGIDISKDKLDICFLTSNNNQKPKFDTLPNNIEVIQAYFNSFIKDNILVVFEATSNYHQPLQQILSDLKIKFSLLNPTKSSLFLKHLTHIKTDITDSYGLAVYAKTFKSEINPSKYNPEYSKIKSYNSAISLLSKLKAQLKNFTHSQEFVADDVLKTILSSLLKQIQNTHEKIKLLAYELIKIYIPETETIVKSNKGFGVDLALNLFPLLHFNRDKSEKQFISFIGLSPRIFQSGSSINKPAKINKCGSSAIRRTLFLTAMVATRFNAKFKERYERLVNKGKNKKVALTAVMCAIVRYLKSFFKFEPDMKVGLINAG